MKKQFLLGALTSFILAIFIGGGVLFVINSDTTFAAVIQNYRKSGECKGKQCPSFRPLDDLSDSADCGNEYACVFEGECYEHSNDGYEKLGREKAACSYGQWWDCDNTNLVGEDVDLCTDVCGFDRAKAGASRVGEFSGIGSRGCCGDDKNEKYFSRDIYGNRISVCCPNYSRYVRNEKCSGKVRLES